MSTHEVYRLAGSYPYLLPPPSPPAQASQSSSYSTHPHRKGNTSRPKISLDVSYTPKILDDFPDFPIPHPHHSNGNVNGNGNGSSGGINGSGGGGVDGDYSSYSALSPLHARGSPRTIYNRRIPAAARSVETLASPLRTRSPIPISTSYTHLPLHLVSTSPPSGTLNGAVLTEAGEAEYLNFGLSAADSSTTRTRNASNRVSNGNVTSRIIATDRTEGDTTRVERHSTTTTLFSGLSTRFGSWKTAERARLRSIQKQKMSNGSANFYFPPEDQEWDPKAVKRLSKVGSSKV